MARYIVQRILSTIPTMLIIIVVGFVIMELPPGDYLTYYVAQLEAQGHEGAREEAELLRRRYALDKPATERFFSWLWRFVQGDFGDSFAFRRPVRDLIGERLLLTLVLSLTSLAISWLIGIPIGVYSATHQYSPGDHFFTLMAFLGTGLPGFLLALVLLVFGSQVLGYTPLGLFSAEFEAAPWSWARLADFAKHLWIPALIVAVTGTAGLMRTMRGNLLDVLRQNYVQTARAKGVTERTVVWKHAVRNAIHPLIAFGLENRLLPPDEIAERLVAALDLCGVGHLRGRALATLSGGEGQRVAIAAMLASRPRVLLFDEPTSNLDPTATAGIFAVLDRLRRETGLTIMVAEHKLGYLRPFGPRLVRMEGGAIVRENDVRSWLTTARRGRGSCRCAPAS